MSSNPIDEDICTVKDCPDPEHVHTVHNPFNHSAAFIEARDAAHAARDRARPNFDYGIDSFSDEGFAERQRRQRLHMALRHEANHYGVSSEYLIIAPFTEADLWNFTHWRPWEITPGGGAGDSVFGLAQEARFKAILNSLDAEHEERHWFYQHPFCRGCFPERFVEDRLAAWMLRHGERSFPADTWDGVLPPEPTENYESLDGLSYDDLASMPEPGWLIPDVLPDSGTGILRARDQSFKSFMALSMALEVVMDGRNVLYCAGEGANQFRKRIDAWLEHEDGPDHGGIEGAPEETLDLRPWVPNLFTADERYERILADARKHRYALIVIDTYARATAGSDLNSQGDQAVVTARVDELRRATGGTVLLVAHSQKSDTDASGSIEIEDARDFVFAMKRNGPEVTFEVTKQKDGVESTEPQRLVAKPVGPSMVLVPVSETEGTWLSDSIKDRVRGVLFATKDALTSSQVISATKDDGTGKPAGRTQVFQALTDLESDGVIERLPGARKGTHTYRYLRTGQEAAL